MATRQRRAFVETDGESRAGGEHAPEGGQGGEGGEGGDGGDGGDGGGGGGVVVRGKSISVGWAALFGIGMGLLSGVGSTVTWKVSTDGVNARQDDVDAGLKQMDADHEARLRALETNVVGGLAEIRAELREIKGRIKP